MTLGPAFQTLLLLAFLTEDEFTGIFHTLALIGLWRTQCPDLGGNLSDAPLVNSADRDFSWLRRCNRNTFRNWIIHIMAIAKRQLQFLAGNHRFVANTGNLQLALE